MREVLPDWLVEERDEVISGSLSLKERQPLKPARYRSGEYESGKLRLEQII